MFEIHRHIHYDSIYNTYTTEKTTNNRGGFYLKIFPALIDGSSVIKAVFYNSEDNRTYNALEVVYDTTDDIQAYIHSSNGDKIYQGIESLGTILTCMVKYQGQLLESNDSRYETNFDFYWFKVSSDGSRTWNIWLDNTGQLLSQELTSENESTIELKSSSRILPINADDVDNINMFQCAVVDKIKTTRMSMRTNLITNSPSEEDIIAASIINNELGIGDDAVDLLNTAYEINSNNITNGTALTN